MSEKIKVIEKIKENYKNINNIVCGELELSSKHEGLSGHCREDFWVDFFRKIIPQKFAMEKGVIIIDSKGKCSNEVDIAVIDNQYTPYVFNYGNLKFIPIEAVAIVIECKSSKWDSKVNEWSKKIEELEAVSAGLVRIVSGNAIGATTTSQKRTTPIKILASMRKNPKDETIDNIKNDFDFILHYKKSDDSKYKLNYSVPNQSKKLGWWSEKLNNHKSSTEIDDKGLEIKYFSEDVKKQLEKHKKDFFQGPKIENGKFIINNTLEDLAIKENSLLSLNFQLNQLLMLINNPMTFPHFAYAKLFKDN